VYPGTGLQHKADCRSAGCGHIVSGIDSPKLLEATAMGNPAGVRRKKKEKRRKKQELRLAAKASPAKK
jgi:hypothetical protein